MIYFIFFFFTAMLSDNNSVKPKSDCSPPVQWCKVVACEDEKTKLVFKRYSQVSVIMAVAVREPGRLQKGCKNQGLRLPQELKGGLDSALGHLKHVEEAL